MFETMGWQRFTEDLEEAVEDTNCLEGIKNSDEFFTRKGYLDGMRRFLAYEKIVRQGYDQLLDPEGLEDEEDI